jgi:hypothetical protein
MAKVESVGGSRVGRCKLLPISLLVAIIVVGVAVVIVSDFGQTPKVTTAFTYYNIGADGIMTSAIQQHPAGYVLQSSKQVGNGGSTQVEDWAERGDSSGSVANMTVSDFPSTIASQTYYRNLVYSQRRLPGYQDVSSALVSFQQYGG